jgi:hypothetical protein
MDDDSRAGRAGERRARIARGTTPNATMNATTLGRTIARDEPDAIEAGSTSDEPARSIREAIERLVGGTTPA